MNLSVGENHFPQSRPCLIGAVVDKLGRHVDLVLSIGATGEYHGELFVPVDKMKALGIRQLITIGNSEAAGSQVRDGESQELEAACDR
jgi:hypothetical protein